CVGCFLKAKTATRNPSKVTPVKPQFAALHKSAIGHQANGKQLLGLSFTAEPESPCSLNGKTTRSRRAIVPFTHLARERRMTVTIGRRELLAALSGAAAAWPLAARHGLSDPSTEESR